MLFLRGPQSRWSAARLGTRICLLARRYTMLEAGNAAPPIDSAPLSDTKTALPSTTAADNDTMNAALQTPTPANGDGEVSPAKPSTDPSETSQPLSKNALKKLKRKQEWEAGRENRKAKRREKVKGKKARKREAASASEDPTTATSALAAEARAKRRPEQHLVSTPVPLTLMYDCSYDELMTENERVSLGSQLTRAYSDVRKARWRPVMVVSGFGAETELRKRFESVLERSHENWKGVRFLEAGPAEAAQQAKAFMREVEREEWRACEALVASEATSDGASQLPPTTVSDKETDHTEAEPSSPAPTGQPGETVYLTSDSPHTLSRLTPHSTYVIGALVDKNRHKGACYKAACSLGLRTAKLPIRDYLQMSSRQVLATSHVGEIMLKWLECGDWGDAFLQVIPARKGGVLKQNGEVVSVEKPETHRAKRRRLRKEQEHGSGDHSKNAGSRAGVECTVEASSDDEDSDCGARLEEQEDAEHDACEDTQVEECATQTTATAANLGRMPALKDAG